MNAANEATQRLAERTMGEVATETAKPQTCYDCKMFSMCQVQVKLGEFIACARICANDETIRMIRERIGADCEMFSPIED